MLWLLQASPSLFNHVRGDKLILIFGIISLWEREDRGVEDVSAEIGNQGARNGALEHARLCSRSTGGGGRSTARSTGVHERAQEGSGRPPGRPTDKALVSVGPGRPARSTVAWAGGRSTDRRVLTFLLGFEFLFWM